MATGNDGTDFAANTDVINNIVVDSGTAAVYFWLWGVGRTEARAGSHHLDNNLYLWQPDDDNLSEP